MEINVYPIAVVSTALYATETKNFICKTHKKFEAFQQRCLRKILNISWQSYVSNH